MRRSVKCGGVPGSARGLLRDLCTVALGVQSPNMSCRNCHHQVVLTADRWPDDVALPTFRPRMVCTGCGIVGADARPNWKEQPQRESLTGVQWLSSHKLCAR